MPHAFSNDRREQLVRGLIDARRTDWPAPRLNRSDLSAFRAAVDATISPGEREPAWRGDGAPDPTRRPMRNTPCHGWYADGDRR